ncbi:putative holin-like toxin [Psychrobacillus soli]|nr:putative holin-like toxin [Psychrobacillus soli]
MTTFETLMFALAFAGLIVSILTFSKEKKVNHP